MKKGLKLRPQYRMHKHGIFSWKFCPDEEGIETRLCSSPTSPPDRPGWKFCPDEEGIETRAHRPFASLMPIVGSSALMKKGLKLPRHLHGRCFPGQALEVRP